MHKDLESITKTAMAKASKMPIVEPKVYEQLFMNAAREHTIEYVCSDDEKIVDFADKLHEQADNIVNAVDMKQYEKIEEYRNKIVTLKNENEELVKIAYTDELTGASSRRWLFSKKIVDEHFLDSGHLAVVDMNAFKLVNDHYGHNVGDAILKFFVESLQRKVIKENRDCSVVRFGGDEFLVLFSAKDNLDDKDVERFFVSLKESLINKIQIKSSGERISVDFSYGYTRYTASSDFREVMEEADKRMYATKNPKGSGNIMSKVRGERDGEDLSSPSI